MGTELKAKDDTAADDHALLQQFQIRAGLYEMQKEHQLGGGGWGGGGAECVLVAATNAHSQNNNSRRQHIAPNSNAQ